MSRLDYQEKKEARIESYKRLALKNEQNSNSACEEAVGISKNVPFGQPILVDHYSAKKHRRDIDKMNNKMKKSVELSKKAEYYQQKADSAERNRDISSDDPDVLKKLKKKLETLQNQQEMMKGVNKIIRNKKLSCEEKKKLTSENYNLSEEEARERIEGDYVGIVGFPSFELTNNNAKIKSTKDRIKKLEHQKTLETKDRVYSTKIGDVVLVDNIEANRIQIYFENKPSEEIKAKLKSYGFKFSPKSFYKDKSKPWQRMRSNNAIYYSKILCREIENGSLE